MSTENRSYAGLSLPRDFPEIVERHLCHKEHKELDRNRDILFRRYGLIDGTEHTLQELGDYHDITRERVRQIQARIVINLRKLLMGTPGARGWTIEPEYLQQFASLKTALGEQAGFYSLEEIEKAIQQNQGHECLDDSLPACWLGLFLELLGYERVAPSLERSRIPELEERWVRTGTLARLDRERTFKILQQVHREVKGRTIFDIVGKARRAGARNVDPMLVRALAGACPRLEETSGEILRLRFSALASGADRAWRVLEESGDPMHFSDVAREVNRRELQSGGRKIFDVRNIANQMTADQRFVPVGRCGQWALSEWEHVDTLTVLDAMQRVLHAAGEPLPLDSIVSGVRKLRPDAKRKSIRTYSDDRKELFGRAAGNRITLKVWAMPETGTRRKSLPLDSEEFVRTVRDIAGDRSEMALKDLVDMLVERLDAAEPTCRQWLRKLEGLEITEADGSRRKTVRFEPACIAISGSSVKTTMRERIQAEIHRCRAQQDTRDMTKKQLHKLVSRNAPCPLPTFYRYLSELESAEAESRMTASALQFGQRDGPSTPPRFEYLSRKVAQ